MAILLPRNAIVLHIPKTGGEWVAEVLARQGLIVRKFTGHADTRTAALEFDQWFRGTLPGRKKEFLQRICYPKRPAAAEKPFFISFVRHPLRWYESMFKYCRQRGWPYHGSRDYSPFSWGAISWLNGIRADSFGAYLKQILGTRRGFLTDLYAEYTGPMVDFVGRTERLADDLVEILGKKGLAFDPENIRNQPPLNTTPCEPLSWDAGIRKEIIQTEWALFERYNYDPEN